MINIKYPDTSVWEDWMHEYKFGAFFIYPPTEILKTIDKLRELHDPKSASISQTHISLSDPLTAPLTSEQLEELQIALLQIEPFEIHYGPLRSFPPYPGVTYTITPEDKFMKLRKAIHETSIFKDSPLTRRDRAPHMTIAEFITVEKTNELLEELQGKVQEGTFLCNTIALAIPNKDFHFQRALDIPLGKRELWTGI